MKIKAREEVTHFEPVQLEDGPTVKDALKITGREIRVWRFRTDSSESSIMRYSSTLATDERERAERFRFDQVRRSFVLTRFALRALLGNYSQVDPARVQFSYRKNGKPGLASQSPVRFNVAHSDGIAVIAFAFDCEVGVDVERIRSFSGMAGVAARFFHPDEAACVNSFPLAERDRAFFDTWVRKEAYIKATGEGLGAGLQGFKIKSGVTVADLQLERLGQPDESWTFHDLRIATHYAGALAYPDHPREVHISELLTFAELEVLLAGRPPS